MDLRKFIAEIQRRHVGRVAGVYAVVAWVVIQVVATVFPLLDISDVAAKIVVLLFALGFPAAIALAWIFDVTPAGLQRTESLPADAPVPRPDARYYGRALGFFGVGILVALVAFAALSQVRSEHHVPSAAGIRSMAVLPFDDLSESRDQAYFADGISEELLNRLAQIPDLKVPARTASFAFRGSRSGVVEIGKRLDVESLLEGSVRRDGNSVRVSVRLIDVQTQQPLWANEYEKQLSSVFAIQDEIASDIVNALKLQISPQPVVAGAAKIDADPAAVEAYMKGLELWNARTDTALRRAIEFFARAVEKDPKFALGHAMLAQAYAVVPAYGDYPTFEASAKGQAAAALALQLNPSQPEAYAALGQIRQNFEWDFESAERSYRRALLFHSGYATAHQWRAEALLLLGEYDESRKEIDMALDLNPTSSSALFVKAYQHVTRREFASANRILDRTLASNPDHPLAFIAKVSVLILTGQPGSVEAIVGPLRASNPDYAAALLAVAAASADPARRTDAARALNALTGRRPASELALWFALSGLRVDALRAIKHAHASGADANLPVFLLHPGFDVIRTSEDYQTILRDLHMVSV